MPKIKTHSGAKKRFKLNKNGKVKHYHENKSHLLTKKPARRRRSLRKASYLSFAGAHKVKALLPYA